MLDPAIQVLIPVLHQAQGNCLWLADENSLPALSQLASFAHKLTLVSNRCDIVDAALALGIPSLPNDGQWPELSLYHQVFFRIAKEKPLVHHWINLARLKLPEQGKLWLSGFKNEGLKSYFDKAATLFNSTAKAQKNGDVYLGELLQSSAPPSNLLDTQNYTELRPVLQFNGKTVYSKPGVYGWDKLDAGSQLLLDAVYRDLPLIEPLDSCLDLGCGYGLLTLGMAGYQIGYRAATDNNIAAIATMTANASHWQLPVDTVLSNCANTINRTFDLILCNPPFHKGFDIHNDLTDTFLAAAKNHMHAKGRAYFVVNQFIAIEKKARRYFNHGQVLADNRHFKVVKCWQ